MSLKKVLTLLLVCVMIFGIAACSGGDKPTTDPTDAPTAKPTDTPTEAPTDAPTEAPAEKTKIEVWSWWGSEARLPVITHIVDYFNQNSDTVEATYVYTPWGDIFTKNLANIASGTPADVMFGNLSDVSYRASQGQTENLKPLMDRDGYSIDRYQDSYTEGLWYDGGIYGIPFVIESRIVYYNKDHFESIGIDTSDPNAFPKTWNQLIDLAYRLDVKNGDKFDRVGFLPLFGNGGWDLFLQNADGGRGWWDPDTGEILVNTPNKVEAVKRIMSVHDHYTDAVVDELAAATSQGMQNPFGSGIISMVVQNTTFARELKTDFPDLNWGTFLVPEFNEGTGHWVNGGGFVVEIPKGAKHIDAAWEFVKYMTSAYAQKYWSKNCFELSALKELLDDEELKNDPVYSTALVAAATTDPGFMPMELNGYKDMINPYLDEVKLRTMSPEDALANAQRDVEDLAERQKGN